MLLYSIYVPPANMKHKHFNVTKIHIAHTSICIYIYVVTESTDFPRSEIDLSVCLACLPEYFILPTFLFSW